jgi:TonB family protein
MRKTRPAIALPVFIFLSIMALPSVCLAQPQPEPVPAKPDVASLLAQTDYKYFKVKEGMWEIQGFPHRGKNIKTLDVFLMPNRSNASLRISVRLGFQYTSVETAKFNEKLKELEKRFEPSRFVLSGQTLFVETELPEEKADKDALVQAMEKAAAEADQAHGELTKFVKLGGEESTGPGSGGGMGVGEGARAPNASPPNRPGASEGGAARSVDTRPVLLSQIRPVYTEEARKNKVIGVVLLRVLIDETGNPTQVRVVRGLPDGLNESAIEAVKKSRFKPAMKDGKPVAFTVTLEVTFNIR